MELSSPEPSNQFTEGESVSTKDGKGVIVKQDSCKASGRRFVWLDRWGIKFEGIEKPKYYWSDEIEKDTGK